jgi:hypothetical protein
LVLGLSWQKIKLSSSSGFGNCDVMTRLTRLTILEKYRPNFSNGLSQFSKKISMILRGIYFTITNKDHDSTLIRDNCKLKMEKG